MYNEKNRSTDLELSTKMGQYWVNFAYDGNPNSAPYEMSTEWKPWNKLNNNERFIVFDSDNDKGIAMFNRTTLTDDEVDEIYRTFISGKCTRA